MDATDGNERADALRRNGPQGVVQGAVQGDGSEALMR